MAGRPARRKDRDEETVEKPGFVGDAELFDVDEGGAHVVKRPEERTRPERQGPALGRG